MKTKIINYISVILVTCVTVCCTPPDIVKVDTLIVTPAENLTFKASGNRVTTLSVKTSASDWNFTAPEWVLAEKDDNILMVNVTDNEEKKARVGRITFTAGSAENLSINVRQEGKTDPGTEPENPPANPDDEVIATLLNKTAGGETSFTYIKNAITASVSVSLAEASKEALTFAISLDNKYIEEYSFIQDKEYLAVPVTSVSLSAATVTIPAGQTESQSVTITLNGENLNYGKSYMLPILATVTSGNAGFSKNANRVNFFVTRGSNRTTKQAVFLEVNNTNPLNILEYNLEDGTPFFDVVILFAANINYDSGNDLVYLHNNPNVQALLDNTETYIQPLRKKGIKVYLGLLGNHTPAGLAQLSDWGAQQWAQEVATAIKTYKLDGVNLDDEYSSGPLGGNRWFTSPSGAAAARLCYELKTAMKAKCDWPTEVSIFEWGSIGHLPTVNVNGVEHKQSEFIDWTCANYGSSSSPYGDLTKANCSVGSKELNRGSGSIDAEKAKREGYGWCMWFAFHPQSNGGINNNRASSLSYFNSVAYTLYGQKLADPQNEYLKNGEGSYDPNPHRL